MANHLFKSRFGQCECRWCGKRNDGRECAVTQEMRYALKLFAHGNGRTWKSKLHHEWETGGYGLGDLGILMSLRNIIGPSGLERIKTHHLDDVRSPVAEKKRVEALLNRREDRWQAEQPEAAAQGD